MDEYMTSNHTAARRKMTAQEDKRYNAMAKTDE